MRRLAEIEALIEREVLRAQVSAPCFAAAGLPQTQGPRKLEAIDQASARQACTTALAEFPEDPALKTMIGRIDHAAGDVALARSAYTLGVEAGVPAAYGLLAYTHYAPAGAGEVDLETAEKLASAGAERGDWLSQELLTVLYSKNLVAGKDAGDAFVLASALADQGNALAQFFVGYFYLTGSGVDADESRAVTWLGQSVKQGYLHAYSFLAELHEQGRGTDLDPGRAADLYWSALLRSDPTARERLTTQLGSRHPDVVRSVQERLRTEGVYRGQLDGIAGPSTVSAVQAFAETLTENS
ncbi:MAG: peptidoglycan-binding protein [Pseudomonadota bacterium]